jgi:phage RecT family recombinase
MAGAVERRSKQSVPAPAPAARSRPSIRELLTSPGARARIEPLLAPDDTYERIVAVTARAVRKQPDLENCDPSSLVDAAATIVGWNLEIGDTAHLVPFKGKVVPIMDYKGMAQILISSGVVRAVEPWAVYEKEIASGDFQVYGGTDARIIHVPHSKATDRGKLAGAYVIFRLKNQYSTFKWMPIEDIDAIRRQHSLKWKDGECPPWYAIKTCIRQARKVLATTPALTKAFAKAFDAFEQDEALELASTTEGQTPRADEFGSPADTPALNAGTPADASLAVGREREPGEEDEEFQDDRDLDDYTGR